MENDLKLNDINPTDNKHITDKDNYIPHKIPQASQGTENCNESPAIQNVANKKANTLHSAEKLVDNLSNIDHMFQFDTPGKLL